MPPAQRITKEAILEAGIALIRTHGVDALNARAIATSLACSTQPIFSNFPSMDALKAALIERAEEIFLSSMETQIADGKYPPYKASGMAYIRFAKEEPYLFQLLYMRDRRKEPTDTSSPLFEQMSHLVQEKTTLDRSRAQWMHVENWGFVHGIAVMLATHYFEPDEELISSMLTDVFQGLKQRHENREENT